DDVARFGVFMYNKSTEPLNSTYLSPTITCSSLEYIQSLLNETLANELMNFMSNPVYTDAHTTSMVLTQWEILSQTISKSADDIMTFRKELDALALKHLGPVPATAPTKEVFSDADDDEMPEIRIYDKSSEGIFEKASYDDDGIITDFNNLPDEVDVSTNHTLRIHNAHPQSQILGDPNTLVQTRSSLKKITEAHALISHIQAQQRSNHKDQQHCLFTCFFISI
ncbi:hypothetical protein Tco_1521558, partial [Tanacetum coccineum]